MSYLCPACRSQIDTDTCPTCERDRRRSADGPPSTGQSRPLLTKRAKLLASRTVRAYDKPVVLLAVRIGSLSLSPTNLTLTAPQAYRLLDDLTQLFNDPELLDAAGHPDGEAKRAFERIMDEPLSTGDRSEEAR